MSERDDPAARIAFARRITGNFVVFGDGRVIDRQVLVLFPRPHHEEGGRS